MSTFLHKFLHYIHALGIHENVITKLILLCYNYFIKKNERPCLHFKI